MFKPFSLLSLVLVLPAFGQGARAHQGRMIGDATRPPEEGVVRLSPVPGQGARTPDALPPGVLTPGTPAAADRQDFLLAEAAKTFSGQNRKGDPKTITEIALSPVIDAETGLVVEDAKALKAAIHNDETIVDSDLAGPLGPGRRARLAEVAGISQEEAAKLWPFPDPKPFAVRDLNLAASEVTRQLSQMGVEKNLVPGGHQDREEMITNAVLTDAEASFAVHAALGLPFPIRVGKVDTAGFTPEGVVIFSPELLRADPIRDDWQERLVSYRWMNNEVEVYKDSVRVQPFMVLPRPGVPTTHLWITCDKDVMVYALRGVTPPGTVSDARDQIQKDVVQVNSWLRPATKIYGVRWGLLPTMDELTKNPSTKAKLKLVMTETGLLGGKREENPYADEMRRMADTVAQSPLPNQPPKPRR